MGTQQTTQALEDSEESPAPIPLPAGVKYLRDISYWQLVSPLRALSVSTVPFLAVCSTRRDEACLQAKRFTAQATSHGTRAQVLEVDLSHRDINHTLGSPGVYTQAVEDFMGSLDVSVRQALQVSPH